MDFMMIPLILLVRKGAMVVVNAVWNSKVAITGKFRNSDSCQLLLKLLHQDSFWSHGIKWGWIVVKDRLEATISEQNYQEITCFR